MAGRTSIHLLFKIGYPSNYWPVLTSLNFFDHKGTGFQCAVPVNLSEIYDRPLRFFYAIIVCILLSFQSVSNSKWLWNISSDFSQCSTKQAKFQKNPWNSNKYLDVKQTPNSLLHCILVLFFFHSISASFNVPNNDANSIFHTIWGPRMYSIQTVQLQCSTITPAPVGCSLCRKFVLIRIQAECNANKADQL